MSAGSHRPFQALLLTLEHIVYRRPNPIDNTVGILNIFMDRFEWNEIGKTPTVVTNLSSIERQRISRSGTSVAIQFVLRDGNVLSFNFVNPGLCRDGLLSQRQSLVDILQCVMGEQRESASQLIKQVEESTDEKERVLSENKHLLDVYRHLVVTKLIKPGDFWSDYYKQHERMSEGVIGVSGAFLTSLPQVEGRNGLKLNLTAESILSIFKTFPSVKKRHQDLVPKKFTEEQFWAKFFHSYYFNRHRTEVDKNDPFLPCIIADDSDMDNLLKNAYVKTALDEKFLKDDDSILKTQDDEKTNDKRISAKTLLVRRCNYQSGRILQTALGQRWSTLTKSKTASGSISLKASNFDASQQASTLKDSNNSNVAEIPVVVGYTNCDESLMATDADFQRYLAGVDLGTSVKYPEKTVSAEEGKQIRDLMISITKPKRQKKHIDNFKKLMTSGNDPFHLPEGALKSFDEQTQPRLPSDLDRSQINELMAINDSCYELIKHFWDLFPPQSENMEKKLKPMVATLKKYKSVSLASSVKEYGAHNMSGIIGLVDNALDCYKKFLVNRKKPGRI